jgi:hypothetical protein
MYANLRDDGVTYNLGSSWYAEQHLMEEERMVKVLVEEVSEGEETHWGWIERDHHGVDEVEPSMIQPHWGMFTMQFHYGGLKEQAAGQGRIVLLRVTVLDGGPA